LVETRNGKGRCIRARALGTQWVCVSANRSEYGIPRGEPASIENCRKSPGHRVRYIKSHSKESIHIKFPKTAEILAVPYLINTTFAPEIVDVVISDIPKFRRFTKENRQSAATNQLHQRISSSGSALFGNGFAAQQREGKIKFWS